MAGDRITDRTLEVLIHLATNEATMIIKNQVDVSEAKRVTLKGKTIALRYKQELCTTYDTHIK